MGAVHFQEKTLLKSTVQQRMRQDGLLNISLLLVWRPKLKFNWDIVLVLQNL